MKTIQSAILVITGITCTAIGITIVFYEQKVPFQYVVGVIICFLGLYAIARGMMGLGFKVEPQVGIKLPL
jgi:cytochrome c biogenesis protein CcdA